MDISQLVPALVTHLAPCLPALWQLGEKFSDGAAKKLGEKAAEGTVQLWQKLRGHAEARPALHSALTDLARTPQDPDLQAALRVQLRQLLAADPALAKELTELLVGATGGSRTQHFHAPSSTPRRAISTLAGRPTASSPDGRPSRIMPCGNFHPSTAGPPRACPAGDGNPNGIVSSSPGLRGTSYPGWFTSRIFNPNGVAPRCTPQSATPLGLFPGARPSQGSSFLATLGWRPESRWDSPGEFPQELPL